MDFSILLREAMGDMTQWDLAMKSGVRQANIHRYLHGSAKPTYDALHALEKTLPRLRVLRNEELKSA